MWGKSLGVQPLRAACYRMNTREKIRSVFERGGFDERHFAFVDDCRTFSANRLLQAMELCLWRVLTTCHVSYPDTCLLGVYGKR